MAGMIGHAITSMIGYVTEVMEVPTNEREDRNVNSKIKRAHHLVLATPVAHWRDGNVILPPYSVHVTCGN